METNGITLDIFHVGISEVLRIQGSAKKNSFQIDFVTWMPHISKIPFLKIYTLSIISN